MRKIKTVLEMDFMILHKWFHENHMVLNSGKCHYIVIGDDDPSNKIILNKSLLHSRSEVIAIKLSSKIPVQLLPTDLKEPYV